MRTRPFLALSVVFSELVAQGTPYLVADLNTTTPPTYEWGSLLGGVRAGAFSVFLEDDGASTRVWRTDGTTAGTLELAAIPGSRGNSFEPEVVTRNGLVFFTAPGSGGDHLWVTDGTVAGTLDIANGGRDPLSLTVDGTTAAATTLIWFSATDSFNGRELWRSDGTVSGTMRMTQIRAGSSSAMNTSPGRQIACATSGVYFAATDGTTGMEVWRIVGGAVAQFADVYPGASQALPRDFTVTGDYVMFSASGPNGREPYCIAQGVLQAINLAPGTSSSSPDGFVVYRASPVAPPQFWFAADDGSSGRELWRYNAFTGGLASTDLEAGGDSNPRDIHVVGARIVCIATQGPQNLAWSIPAAGGAASVLVPMADAAARAFGSGLLLETTTPGLLHYSDGLVAVPLFQEGSSASVPLPFGDRCLLTESPNGSVLTNAGTISRLVPSAATAGSDPRALAAMPDSSLVFVANDTLYRTDGTAAGTLALSPSALVTGSLSPMLGGRRYFVTSAPASQLRATDGSVAGTTTIGSLGLGTTVTWSVLDSRLLLFLGSSLYVTDGVSAPQVLAQGIPANPSPHVVGGVVVFRGSSAASGTELWATDGTLAGTGQIAELAPGVTSGVPDGNRFAAVASGHLVFAGFDGTSYGLWRTDGTGGGSTLVMPLTNALSEVAGSALGLAWFHDAETVFSSDGTTAGTVSLGVSSMSLQVHGELLGKAILYCWFVDNATYASSGTAATTDLLGFVGLYNAVPLTNYLTSPPTPILVGGSQIAATDGTSANTFAIGANGGSYYFSSPGADVALFASGGGLDQEPWRSNGTTSGTARVADLHPGNRSSDPTEFTSAGGLIYFSANDGAHGRELWAMTAPASAVAYGAGCPGSLLRTPTILATALPRLGGTFEVGLDEALANSVAIQILGLGISNTPIGGGCTLLATSDVTNATLTGPTGAARLATPIPNALSLAGLTLHSQFAVMDPAGAFAGILSFSGGLQGVVGL